MIEILDISLLRDLQGGTPTPPARTRKQGPPPLKLDSKDMKLAKDSEQYPVFKSVSTPANPVATKTPVDSKAADKKPSPHTPVLPRFSSDPGFKTPEHRPYYEIYEDFASDSDDEEVEMYLAPMENINTTHRTASLSFEELDNLPPFTIVAWPDGGDEFVLTPNDTDWRVMWKAIMEDHPDLCPGIYMWKDGHGEEFTKRIKPDPPQVNTDKPPRIMADPDFPRKCPLPPHLADLPPNYVCMITQSGDERLLSPTNALSLVLRDENCDEVSLKRLPAGCTFRWKNENDESFVFTAPEDSDDEDEGSVYNDAADSSFVTIGSNDYYTPSEDELSDDEASTADLPRYLGQRAALRPVTPPNITRHIDPRSPRTGLIESPNGFETIQRNPTMNFTMHSMNMLGSLFSQFRQTLPDVMAGGSEEED
ncbi:hypothetical protein FRC02_008497 [Tulasnella sp. 418]|nr:hypothetical protein FRC02_008497 [Tulasnella sp. 418]